jgi:uncharacterized protein YodC (DUF2158 family)
MTVETIEVGSVVALKSGGQAMTVIAVDSDSAECLWCGEEGDLFRENIPTVALQIAQPIDPEEDEDEEEGDKAEKDEAEEDEAEVAAAEAPATQADAPEAPVEAKPAARTAA